MRRVTSIATVALALSLAAAGTALASHNGDRGGPQDFAVGTGSSGESRVSFAAHGGPSPSEPVSGHFTAKGSLLEVGGMDIGAFMFEGPVTCLQVTGNRAGLFYPIRNADPKAFEGSGVFITVEDNGNPSGDTPDRLGFVGPVPLPADPISCPPGPTPMDLDEGNITVHDAP